MVIMSNDVIKNCGSLRQTLIFFLDEKYANEHTYELWNGISDIAVSCLIAYYDKEPLFH